MPQTMMTHRPSAIGEVRKQCGVPVLAILTLVDVVEHLKGLVAEDDLKGLEEYRNKYKASDWGRHSTCGT